MSNLTALDRSSLCHFISLEVFLSQKFGTLQFHPPPKLKSLLLLDMPICVMRKIAVN